MYNWIRDKFILASNTDVEMSENITVATAYLRSSGSVPLLFQYVFSALLSQLSIIGCESELNNVELEQQIINTLHKNRSLKGGLIRIDVIEDRAEPLFLKYNLIYSKLEIYHFDLNRKGLAIEIFSFCPKPKGILFSLPLACSFIFNLASRQVSEKNAASLLLLNPSKRLACGIYSLVYLVRGNKVLTVSYDEGAVIEPMFDIIRQLARDNGMHYSSELKLTVNDILISDEVFLADMKNGIQWVVAYGSKRFYNRVSSILATALDKLAFS